MSDTPHAVHGAHGLAVGLVLGQLTSAGLDAQPVMAPGGHMTDQIELRLDWSIPESTRPVTVRLAVLHPEPDPFTIGTEPVDGEVAS